MFDRFVGLALIELIMKWKFTHIRITNDFLTLLFLVVAKVIRTKETCNFWLKVCLNMYDQLLPPGFNKGLIHHNQIIYNLFSRYNDNCYCRIYKAMIYSLFFIVGPLYFPPRALPSAGALPFLQSYICNYNMTETFADPMELPDFSSTV